MAYLFRAAQPPSLLPGMLLAQLMVTTISRSKRSQRVATAGRCPSGLAGSGMAYSFSGSTTSRWDTRAFTGAEVTGEDQSHKHVCQASEAPQSQAFLDIPVWPSLDSNGKPEDSVRFLREWLCALEDPPEACG